MKEIAARHAADKKAQLLFNAFGNNLGNFIKDSFNLGDIDMVVLEGNIANALNLFGKSVQESMKESVKKPLSCRSVPGEKAAMVGAVSFPTLFSAL